jgi:hypothetical protein
MGKKKYIGIEFDTPNGIWRVQVKLSKKGNSAKFCSGDDINANPDNPWNYADKVLISNKKIKNNFGS